MFNLLKYGKIIKKFKVFPKHNFITLIIDNNYFQFTIIQTHDL